MVCQKLPKGRDVGGRVTPFQRRCQPGEQGRDVLRNLRAAQGRVERPGIEPNPAQHLPHLRPAQVRQVDAEALAVRELRVMLAGAGKVRIQVEAESHVAHEEERRPAFLGRQVAGVAFRVALDLLHVAYPGRGIADVGPVLSLAVPAEQAGLPVRGGALLGFAHEAAAAIQVARRLLVLPSSSCRVTPRSSR